MGDTFAIHALHRKRGHLAGEIEAGQVRLCKQRDALATLDAVIRMFEPQGNPELIAPIRPVSHRCLFFRHGELPRLCCAALHAAGKPAQARSIAEYAMQAKGLEVEPAVKRQIIEQIRQTLTRLGTKGLIRKVVVWPDVWWEFAV